MLFLLLSIIASALIGNLLMVFKRDETSNIYLIFLGNYVTASIFSLANTSGSITALKPFDVILGCKWSFVKCGCDADITNYSYRALDCGVF
jgi:hypothetical protein